MMKTILLLDDDKLLGQMLEQVLVRRGYAVRRATTIAEGRDFLAAGGVDLAAFDVSLPDGNGWDVLRDMRADPDCRRASLPVIMLSSYSEDRDLARQLHISAYVQKPFSTHAFVETVQHALAAA